MKPLLIVDGYNVINASDALSALDISHARHVLLNMLKDYAGYLDIEFMLVFDAYMQRDGEPAVQDSELVIFTAAGETADMYIERTVRKLAEERQLTVVTSDSLEQIMVFEFAGRLSSRELLLDMEAAREAYRKRYIMSFPNRRNLLEGRLDSNSRDELERMRRS